MESAEQPVGLHSLRFPPAPGQTGGLRKGFLLCLGLLEMPLLLSADLLAPWTGLSWIHMGSSPSIHVQKDSLCKGAFRLTQLVMAMASLSILRAVLEAC